MSPLAIRAFAGLALVGAGFAAAWTVQGWRYGQQIAQTERDQLAAIAAQSEAYRLKERVMNKQVEEARNEAIQREAKIRRAAAGASNAVDSLRGDLAAIRRRIPELTDEAVRQYATTLGDVFRECAKEYREMAEIADRHASDAKTLSDAWPK